MDNHPIPQDVTGFKFRIIGSITVKQFLYLLGSGVAVAILIFLIPMNLILKIPLVILLGGIGPLFAFIPIEGRPADLMVANFFQAVFSNSVYLYHKQGANLALFPALGFAPAAPVVKQPAQESRSDVKRALLARTLRSSTYAPDAQETQRIQDINSIFSNGSGVAPTPIQASPSIARPPVNTNGESGISNYETKNENRTGQNSPTNQVSPQTSSTVKQAPSLVVETADPQQTGRNNQKAINNEQTTANSTQKMVNNNQRTINNNQQTIAQAQSGQDTGQVPQEAQKNIQTSQGPTPQENSETQISPQQGGSSHFDSLPDRPNVILGVVLSPRGKALGNIIVEVQDSSGTPVRTLKTNMEGKFAAATPLPNGEYTISFEDPRGGNTFDTMKVSLAGEIFQPVVATSTDAREELRKNLFGG